MVLSHSQRRWRSGQSHLAVNQAASAYAGSNPARRTNKKALEMGLFRDGGREVRTYSECSCKHGAIMVLLFAGQHLFFGGTTMNHYREESTIRTEMVEILRYMWDRGHANTTGVSISERSSNNRIVVDQSGTGFTRCRATEDDLLVIDPDCRLVEDAPNGAHRKAPVNVVIQTEYYKVNPLARACVHCHAPYTQVFACEGKAIPPYTLQALLMGEIPCVMSDDRVHKQEYHERKLKLTVPTGLHDRPDVYYAMLQVAKGVVTVLEPRRTELEKHGLAATHYQHGIFVFGRSMGKAFDNLERAEANARALLLAAAAGLRTL